MEKQVSNSESFVKHANIIPPEQLKNISVKDWREKINLSMDPMRALVESTDIGARDGGTENLIEKLTGGKYKTVKGMQAADRNWESLPIKDRIKGRQDNLKLCENMAIIDQVAYLALEDLGFVDYLMSAGDIEALLPEPLKGCGESVLAYAVGNDEIRGLLSRADTVYASTRFMSRADVSAYAEYLGAQASALAEIGKTDDVTRKEKQAVGVYFEQRILAVNEVSERLRGRGEVIIPDSKKEQLELTKGAVRVFEALNKAPGEGLEIMDHTVIFNAFILDGLKGDQSKVDLDVLREMKARVRSLISAKALKSAGGFMPSDRVGLDVVSAIERLRGTDDLLNYDDINYFFGGLAEKNGLPVREVWDIREKMDFGTEYEDRIKKIVDHYDHIKDEVVVKTMFQNYGLPETAENFKKIMYEGDYLNIKGSRPTKDVPFFADRGQTFSEDSNVLRKQVVKRSLEIEARDKYPNNRSAEAEFTEAWGVVDILRFSTVEDIRARINLEGHYTIWEGMSGILNTLDRAGKLKQSADLYWVGQQIIQTGAPYLCYVMRHDIHTPILANEINPLAFLDIKTDMSYWSAWIKTTQKASDYLTSGLDQKSLGTTLKALYDVTSKSMKAPAIVHMGEDGYMDNMKRTANGEFKKDPQGRREIDDNASEKIKKRLKELYVRQTIQGLINAGDVSNGDDVEGIAKVAIQFRNEMLIPQYSDINYGKVSPIVSTQPKYQEILKKAGEMDANKTMDAKAFMTSIEFDNIVNELGLEREKWKARLKGAGAAVILGLLGTDKKK